MIRFYLSAGPNPIKVALMLEEIGLPYEPVRIDLYKGEQHDAEFRKLNPNGKLPVIVDTEGFDGRETIVFDSNAILLYLAEKTGKLLGKPADRGALLSWLMFVGTGLGPFCGQAAHFLFYTPEKIPYGIHRYRSEVERHIDVLETELAKREYIAADDFTIVDVDAWGWISRIVGLLPGDTHPLDTRPHVRRWLDAVEGRPAVGRARALLQDMKAKLVIDETARRALYAFQYTTPAP